jgi:uncharacterized membrane protein
MYHAITDFLRTVSAEHRVLWALLTLGVVAGTSLALFCFWELVLRFLLPILSPKKNSKGRMG